MKNIPSFFLFLFLFLIPVFSSAQELNDLQLVNRNLVMEPSPNASSLGTFGEYDVSYYTGTLNLGIPIHTIQGRGISHSISLSYNGGGNKVETVPSWVGLGWNLNAGGVISRTVQGNPDLDWNYYDATPYDINLQCIDMCEQNRRVELNQLETKPDLYSLFAGGINTTFIITPAGELIKKSRDGLKITPHYGTTSFQQSNGSYLYQQEITSFTVLDQKGNQYIFNQEEQSTYMLDDESNSNAPRLYFFNSAWYLSKIKAATTVEEIRFEYHTDIVDTEIPFNLSNYEYYTVFTGGNVTDQCSGQPSPCGTGANNGGTVSLSVTQIKILERKRLHKIIYHVEDDVETMVFNSSAHNYHNYPGDHFLSHIDLYGISPEGIDATQLLKFWLFNYEDKTPRLMLKSVQEGGATSSIPAYTFEYNTIKLPASLQSDAQDYWGYFNGSNNGNNLIPNVGNYGSGANRNTSSTYMKAGILKKINYPTGGSTAFFYERHKVKPHIFGDPERYVGGLRISKVSIRDADESLIEEKEFKYVKNEGSTLSSGIIFSEPRFSKTTSQVTTSCPQVVNGDEPPCNTSYTCYSLNIYASSASPLKMINGSYAGYSRVEVVQDGIGKTVYHYRNEAISPYDFFANEQANGDLLRVEVKDLAGNLVQETVNSHSFDGTGNIQSEGSHPIAYPEAKSIQDNQHQLCEYIDQGNTTCIDQLFCEQGGQDCLDDCLEITEYDTKGEIARTFFRHLVSSATTDYFPDQTSVSVSKDYEYDNTHITAPTSYTEFSSSGIYKTEIEYAHEMNDPANGLNFNGFILANRIAEPIRTKRYKGSEFILGTYIDYFDNSGSLASTNPQAMIQLYPNNIEVPIISDIDYDGNNFPVGIQRYTDDFYHSQSFEWDNARLMATSTGSHSKTFDYHPGTRYVSKITNIDGTQTKYAYDDYWRVENLYAKNSGPDQYEVQTTYAYSYGGTNAVSTLTTFTDDTPDQSSSETFDGIGRSLSSSVNGILKNQNIYDNKGRLHKQTYLPGTFIEFDYYDSPLNRLEHQYFPDNTFLYFEYSGEDESYKKSTTDENGNTSSSYTDPIGRVIKTVDALDNTTLYEYHISGQIQTIKPPNWQEDNVYEYGYDERYRLEQKTIPGAGTSSYKYNDGDQLVASIMPSYPGWMITVNDLYGRPIQTGFYDGTISDPNNALPDPTKVLTETYYDAAANVPNDAPGISCGGSILIGKVVATKAREIIGANNLGDWFYTVNCYDDYGRANQAASENILNGMETVNNTFNLADNLKTSLVDHFSDFSTAQIAESYTYDDFLMPEETRQIISTNGVSHPEEFLSKLDFNNATGQLITKELGGSDTNEFLQKVDYAYNIRGWMTSINETTPSGGQEIPDCGAILNTPSCQKCDYLAVIPMPHSKDEIINITYDGGTSIPLNYPYRLQNSFELETDLENWMNAEGHEYQAIYVSGDGGVLYISITQTKKVFNEAFKHGAGSGPIFTTHPFVQSNCTGDGGGTLGITEDVCDICTQYGYDCEACPYFDLQDPCTTCAELSIASCTQCQYEADFCTQCQNLGYPDCSTCPLTVELIKPLKLRVAYNHANASIAPMPLNIISVEQEYIDYLHDGTQKYKSKDSKVLAGSGDLQGVSPTHVFDIDLSDQWITLDALATVLDLTEIKIEEELTIAGINDATTQSAIAQAVVTYLAETWSNITYTGDISEFLLSNNRDLFSMELFYGDDDPMISSSAQYNGNIRGMKWQVAGQSVQSYSFDYDASNRLELGLYRERLQDGSFTTQNKYGVEFSYDAVGNITDLQRRGVVQICDTPIPSFSFGVIDDLSYTIGDKNQVTLIAEAAQKNYGYKGEGGDYQYDAAGNLSYDGNKKMSIDYNYMNLPATVSFIETGASITFTYDADGNKLKKESAGTDPQGNSVNYIQYYIGGIEYKNETIEAINNSEGRFVPVADGAPHYEYNLTDHLGNVRVVFSDLNGNGNIELAPTGSGSELLQENHYYPFGMKMDGPWQGITSNPENKYGFGSKELNDDFGWDWLDYGARWYDPAIARWANVDPLAEAMASWSPYNYGFDNPVTFSDPSGLAPSTSLWGTDVAGEKSGEREGRSNTSKKEASVIDGILKAVESLSQDNSNTVDGGTAATFDHHSGIVGDDTGGKMEIHDGLFDFINKILELESKENGGNFNSGVIDIDISIPISGGNMSEYEWEQYKKDIERLFKQAPEHLKSAILNYMEEVAPREWMHPYKEAPYSGIFYTPVDFAGVLGASGYIEGITNSSGIKSRLIFRYNISRHKTNCANNFEFCEGNHRGKGATIFKIKFTGNRKGT